MKRWRWLSAALVAIIIAYFALALAFAALPTNNHAMPLLGIILYYGQAILGQLIVILLTGWLVQSAYRNFSPAHNQKGRVIVIFAILAIVLYTLLLFVTSEILRRVTSALIR